MDIIQNFNIIAVGAAIAGIVILGCVVFFNNRKSFTNQTFFVFTLVAAAWNGVNYLAYQFSSPLIVLWLLRAVLFFRGLVLFQPLPAVLCFP